MKVVKTFRYRIDPNPEQEQLLMSNLGAVRFAYNHMLSIVSENRRIVKEEKESSADGLSHSTKYISASHFSLNNLWVSIRDDVAPWYKENSSQAYNTAGERLASAFANMDHGRKYPKYKKRSSCGSVKFGPTSFSVVDSHHIKIYRVGSLKTYESMRKVISKTKSGKCRISGVTVCKTTGGWFVHLTAHIEQPDPRPRQGGDLRIIGIDVGITKLFTGATPGGSHVLSVEHPRYYLKAQEKMSKAQKVCARRRGPRKGQAPSKRWLLANKKVQKIYARTKNQRINLLHNVTSDLVKNYDVIVVEDLNIVGLMKNKRLGKHISDASWNTFVRQLEYKSEWAGVKFVKADRFFASSKICSECGEVKAKLLLTERTYCCEHCGTVIDRDLNAAVNLANIGKISIFSPEIVEGESAGTNSVTGRGDPDKTEVDFSAAAKVYEASTISGG